MDEITRSSSRWNMVRLAGLISGIAFLAFFVSCATAQSLQDTGSQSKLDAAIFNLKNMVPDNIVPGELSHDEEQAKGKAIEEAWRTIEAAGENGVQRLKEEAKRTPPQHDNFFKLNAARFLWMHSNSGRRYPAFPPEGNWDQVADILAIWEGARLTYHFFYPFYTAIAAAATQDPRALPLMKALLKEHEGLVQTAHMPIAWPVTDQFIWGIYGPKGLPFLMEVLRTASDRREKISAVHLLGDGQYLEALPLVRQFTTDSDLELRVFALLALGQYGHPEDFDTLTSGLGSDSQTLVFVHVKALTIYGDLRAVPLLIPLLVSENPSIRQITIEALDYLLAPASLDALHGHAQKASLPPNESDLCNRLVEGVLKREDLTWDSYTTKRPEEREALLRKLRADRWSLGANEQAMSRAQFVEATRQWKEGRRPITAKHLVAATTAADIELLQEVKAAVLMRLSDEALYEAREIDWAVEYLGRSRYRKDPGVTEKVELRE